MSYTGKNPDKAGLIYSNYSKVNSAGTGAETLISQNITDKGFAAGEMIKLVVIAQAANNANNKSLELKVTGGGSVSIVNTSTPAPNSKSMKLELNVQAIGPGNCYYYGFVEIDGVVQEMIQGSGTADIINNFAVSLGCTTSAATDIQVQSFEVYGFKKI
jgi:hypothetical protein